MSHQYMMIRESLEAKGWKLTNTIPKGRANYRYIYTHSKYGDNAYIELYTQLINEYIKVWFKRNNLPTHEELLCFDGWTKENINEYLKLL